MSRYTTACASCKGRAQEARTETTTDADGHDRPGRRASGSLRDWEGLRADHRRAADAFAAAASAVTEPDWQRTGAQGQWSAGQIGEHLVLTYEAVLRELAGNPGMKVRTGFWLRRLIRFRYLGMILRDGRFPRGAQAVREIRPSAEPRSRDRVVPEFLSLAARFDDELTRARAAGRARMTHPIFGTLGAGQTLRFLTVHIDHHRGQLPGRHQAGAEA